MLDAPTLQQNRLVQGFCRHPPTPGDVGKNRLTGTYGVSPSRVTLLEYDELDRVNQITFPDSETIQYEHDEEGAVTKMTDVHGNVTNYTYYNDGRLYEVILERPSVADRVFTYSYDAAGRLAQIDYPSSTHIVVKFSGPSSEPGWDQASNLLHMRYLLSNAHLHRFAYRGPLTKRKKSYAKDFRLTSHRLRRIVYGAA